MTTCVYRHYINYPLQHISGCHCTTAVHSIQQLKSRHTPINYNQQTKLIINYAHAKLINSKWTPNWIITSAASFSTVRWCTVNNRGSCRCNNPPLTVSKYLCSQRVYVYTAEREKPERFHVLTDVTVKTQVCCHGETCQTDRFTCWSEHYDSPQCPSCIYRSTRHNAPGDLNIQRKTNLALLRDIYSITAVDAHYSNSCSAFNLLAPELFFKF